MRAREARKGYNSHLIPIQPSESYDEGEDDDAKLTDFIIYSYKG